MHLVESKLIPLLLPQLGFASTFPQDEETKTVPRITKALERAYQYTKLGVYHGCVMIVGFPATVIWAITAALLSFFLTWFALPFLNIVSVCTARLLPMLRLPMMVFVEVCAPCIEVCVKGCVKIIRKSRNK